MAQQDGFEFSGQGRLKRIDTFTSKAGKDTLTLIFEINGQYPQLVPVKVFGRMVAQASAWTPGSILSVTGRLGGRDWNGKVYGDIVATQVDIISAAEPRTTSRQDGAVPQESSPNDDSVPF